MELLLLLSVIGLVIVGIGVSVKRVTSVKETLAGMKRSLIGKRKKTFRLTEYFTEDVKTAVIAKTEADATGFSCTTPTSNMKVMALIASGNSPTHIQDLSIFHIPAIFANKSIDLLSRIVLGFYALIRSIIGKAILVFACASVALYYIARVFEIPNHFLIEALFFSGLILLGGMATFLAIMVVVALLGMMLQACEWIMTIFLIWNGKLAIVAGLLIFASSSSAYLVQIG